jgi:hypothetical protein
MIFKLEKVMLDYQEDCVNVEMQVISDGKFGVKKEEVEESLDVDESIENLDEYEFEEK